MQLSPQTLQELQQGDRWVSMVDSITSFPASFSTDIEIASL
jgi:hypothetical protein